MRATRIALLLFACGCAKRSATGDAAVRAPIDIAGIYAMRETVYSSDCSPALSRSYGIDARHDKVRVEVRNSVPYTSLMMTVGVMTYDGQVLPNGRFELKPVSTGRNRVSLKESASGTFTSSSFSARYMVEATGPAGPCKVSFLWEANRL